MSLIYKVKSQIITNKWTTLFLKFADADAIFVIHKVYYFMNLMPIGFILNLSINVQYEILLSV